MSQEQKPIQKKIESVQKYKNGSKAIPKDSVVVPYTTYVQDMLALAQYIKEEVLPEERSKKHIIGVDTVTDMTHDAGFNMCRSKVVDKFKELGI